MEQRTYSVDQPQEMILNQAPNAGAEARRIWEQGVFKELPSLSLENEVSLPEAIANSFSFVQLYQMESGDADRLNCRSAGLPWDRQRPMEEAGMQIVEQILGGKGSLRWFGPHKLVGFLEGEEKSEEMLHRFVDAPRGAYQQHFPNLSQAVNELQDLRAKEVFNQTRPKEALSRAYQDDNQHTFAWDYQKDQTGEFWAINLDNQPQSLTSLALKSPDQETMDMLLVIQNFFKGSNRLNRYVVEFDFSATVSCCNISFNAQQVKSITSERSILVESGLLLTEKKYDACKYCQKVLDPKEKKDSCQSCLIQSQST